MHSRRGASKDQEFFSLRRYGTRFRDRGMELRETVCDLRNWLSVGASQTCSLGDRQPQSIIPLLAFSEYSYAGVWNAMKSKQV